MLFICYFTHAVRHKRPREGEHVIYKYIICDKPLLSPVATSVIGDFFW